jgi:hypothetical protein
MSLQRVAEMDEQRKLALVQNGGLLSQNERTACYHIHPYLGIGGMWYSITQDFFLRQKRGISAALGWKAHSSLILRGRRHGSISGKAAWGYT